MTKRQRPRIGLALVVLVCGAFFFFPLFGAAKFGFYSPIKGLTLDPIREVTKSPKFSADLWLSVRLALATTAASLVLMLPTLVWLHLKVPRLRSAAELISILPYVVPGIAIVAGAAKAFRTAWPFILVNPLGMIPLYIIVALPFTYRSLDSGIRAIDLKTLVEASRSLGAGWTKSILSVVIPNMRTAMLGASFLTIAVVLGEYTISALLLHDTFPVYLVQANSSSPRGGPALSLVAIVLTWILLGGVSLLGRQRKGTKRSAAIVAGS